MKRTFNMPDSEPDQKTYPIPSEGESLFVVSDILEDKDPDPNVVLVKCEVSGGTEEGRSLLHRLNLDENSPGFFAVRLFLKAVGLPHKGKVDINTDDFQGRSFYANVIHNKSRDGNRVYANISSYNYDKMVDNSKAVPIPAAEQASEELSWDG